MRIFLNGFMGSGKSTIGKHLADSLNYYFVDLDDYIEEKTFSKINLLFKQFGEPEFRKIEKEYLLDLAVYENMVVACGGGTITNEANEKWMNENGITFFLDEKFETVFQRLNQSIEIEKRPLLKVIEGKNFKNDLQQLYLQRQTFYKKCKLKIESKKNILSTVEAMIQQLKPLL